MIRLFVGLQLPQNIRQSLSALCCGLPGAKWVDPNGFHITLRFIGEIDNRLAADIDGALLEIQAKSLRLRLSGVGQFGPPEKAHAVWAGVERNEALYHLHSKVESAVSRAGAGPDHRRFTPHVTLGRLHRTPMEWLEGYLVQNSNFKTEEFSISELTLFSSHPGDGARNYLPEASYKLG